MPSATPAPATSSPSSASPISLYSQSRLRPINARTSSTPDEERGSRASLETMGGNSVETVVGVITDADHARPLRSHAVSQQQQAVHFPAASSGTEESEDGMDADCDDDEVEAGSEEYVVALHDFSSTNATCLSFLSGQVIKVFNRDESGWWDGELDGQRGWFPSNYVDEDGMATSAEMQSSTDPGSPRQSLDMAESELDHHSSAPRPRHRLQIETSTASSSSSHTATYAAARGIPHPSRSPTPTANTYLGSNRTGSSVLDPIYHAISLLHNAVQANRVAHFQPSTACVISSVRSVLSATDCLTRESSVLRAHPILAKERKQILAELSKLVTQARNASAPMADEARRGWEMEEMLRMADFVLKNVKTFLEVAIECGVAVPDRRSSVYDDLYDERRHPTGPNPHRTLFSPTLDRSDQDKTPTPESPRSSTYRTAYTSEQGSPRSSRSFVDLRSTSLPPRSGVPHAAKARAHNEGLERVRSDSLQSDTQASSSYDHSHDGFGSGSGSGSGSGTSHSDSCDSLNDGVADSNVSSSVSSASEPLDCAPSEVLERLKQANDHLLSIIAAFIGHIHSHTRDSHASSYAFLIDLTRATVDGVRNLLVVVEAVHESASLQAELPRQMSILWETRESVYEATAALVTAARIITSASTAAHAQASPVFANEEEEKAKLLQTATAVLRTGGECVGAVKLCLNRANPDLQITISALSPSQQAQNKKDSEEAAVGEELVEQQLVDAHDEYQPATLKRGKHTLSFLGRKATSLSCLREQYERDDASVPSAFSPIDEAQGEASSSVPLQAKPLRSKKQPPLALRPVDTRPSETSSENTGEGSDSSEPMSRDHSRASGSTLHSARSDSTADTSARPSMERGEVENLLIDERAVPNSAPVLGSFPRPGVERKFSNDGSGFQPVLRNRSASLATSDEHHTPSSPASSSAPSVEGRRVLLPDHDQADVCFNSEGQLTGATLQVLVEKMTPHDTTIDASFSNTFFLCFRLFTTPNDLFDTLEARYNMRAPVEVEMDAEEFTKWTECKVAPVRLRVFNFFKMWLENHWNAATDFDILERLIHFTQTSMTHSLHRPGQRLAELAMKRQKAGKVAKATMQINPTTTFTSRGPGSLKRIMSTDRVKLGASVTDVNTMYSAASFTKSGPTPPTPVVSKGLMAMLRSTSHTKINVVDFDPLELARQFTIMESKIYCSILPEELLGQEFSKKAGVSNAVHVKTMSSLSTYITGWISECILGEEDARKRTQLVKFFIKLGDRCLGLSNFNTLMAIQCALNSSTIARLKRTWDGLPTKYRHMMDYQRRAIEHTRNFAGYRQTLRQTVAPALPFVGLFLTDLTFCHEGNASTRPSPGDPSKKLLNFDKYVKMSRIIGDLQRFQVPYSLVEVPEIQSHLQVILNEVQQGKGAGSADDLYRRSLLLEPRSTTSNNDSGHHPSPATIAIRGASDSKLGLDLFNWK